MLGLYLQALFVAGAVAQEILLPAPTGPHGVFIRTSEIVDTSRKDGNYPKTAPGQPRRLMVSAFTPSDKADPKCRSQYMLPKVGESLYRVYKASLDRKVDFSRFVLPLCSEDVTFSRPALDSDTKPNGTLPLVLFSPGYGVSRFAYNIFSASLASYGFLVLTIDHPFSSGLIQFPDGTFLRQKVTDDNDITRPLVLHDIAVRAADVTSILDALTSDATLTQALFPRVVPNYDKIGIWGHSFGGATAAQGMYHDAKFNGNRIKGGINLDGRMFGPVVYNGFDRPFILWQSTDGASREREPSWRKFWRHLRGFRLNIGVEHAQHFSYTDFEVLADAYPFHGPGLLGGIHGKRDVEIVTAYSKAFFEYLLKGKGTGLLDGPSKRFPEVFFIP